MGRNESEIILSASEAKLVAGLRRGETAIKGYGDKAMAVFRRTGAVIGQVSDRHLTRFNSMLGGAAIALAGKAVIDFDSKLARLSIQAGLSKQQMMGLKTQLFDVAAATKQSPTALLEGVSAIVERTGNFKFAIDSLRDMGIVASATGASMADIGATASNLQEKMGILPNEIMTVFDILNEQGKKGSFTLQNMASLFERLLSAAGRFDVTGVSGMRQFGAFLQIARRGTGSSEQAATAVERTIADIISKASVLKGAGIDIFDPARSKAAGRNVMRDFDAVLKEVIVKTKGDALLLGKIFGEESIRAITPLAQSFKKFGDFREMDEFAKMGGDGAQTMKDFAFWTEQTAATIGDFQTLMSKFANKNLAGPITALNWALSQLNKNPIYTNAAVWTLLGLTGAMVVSKYARGVAGMFGGAKGAGGIAGGLGGGAGMPIPVYVVNRHLSMLPGKGWGFPGGGSIPGSAGAAGGMAGLLRSAGKWILPVAIPLAAYGWMRDRQKEARGENNLVTPSSEWMNRKSSLPDLPKGMDATNPANWVKNEINIKIDKDGRVTTESDNTNTSVAVNRGNFDPLR